MTLIMVSVPTGILLDASQAVHIQMRLILTHADSSVTNANNVNVDEKNDNVAYQVLFSDANGTGFPTTHIDTDNAPSLSINQHIHCS